MLSPKNEYIYRRFNDLTRIKSPIKNLIEQVDEFFTPDEELLTGSHSLRSDTALQGELLDTSGSDLIDEYVAFVLGLQFITDQRWFSIRSLLGDPMDDINRILNARAEELYTHIGNSNYYNCMPELERDTVLYGHGVLVMEADEAEFVKCYTVDAKDAVFAQDRFGKIDFICWPETVPAFELMKRFPELREDQRSKDILVNQHKDDDFMLLTCVENMGKEWTRTYVAYTGGATIETRAPQHFINIHYEEKFKYQPAFPVRDMLTRRSYYGLGIGRKALTKARVLNKLMNNLLKLSGLQSNPPRVQHPQISQEVGVNAELQEGQVITSSKAILDQVEPAKAVQLLQVTGRLDGLLQLYQLQQSMFIALLPTAGSIYKVARQSINEIQQRLEEQEKRLAPLRVNFLKEGPSAHLKVMYQMAEDRGLFNKEHLELPEGLRFSDLDFTVDAFLLSAYKQGKALRAAQALGLVSNFLSLMPSGIDNFNIDKLVEIGFDGFNVLDILEPRSLVQSKREQQQAQLQQQQLMQQQQAQAATDASNAKLMQIVAEMEQGRG